jgi:hypothetical protein
MEQSEFNALMYTGAKLPDFKLTNGQEVDYQLAIAMMKSGKSKI